MRGLIGWQYAEICINAGPYRLTIQTNGETTCSRAEACMQAIPPDLASGDHSTMVSGDDSYHEAGDNEDDHSADSQSHSDDITPTSTAISMYSLSAGVCWRFKELIIWYNISLWEPRCNCQGLYKPVQCKQANAIGQPECWCASSLRGSSIVGTRKPFQCTDPASL